MHFKIIDHGIMLVNIMKPNKVIDFSAFKGSIIVRYNLVKHTK